MLISGELRGYSQNYILGKISDHQELGLYMKNNV